MPLIKKSLKYAAYALAAIMSIQSYANQLEDVVYKKDGSVLRGVLIEQDFEKGRYKIQLQGGSVFAIEKADIEKITKEQPLAANAQDSDININIENNPSITQSPEQTLEQQPNMQASLNALAGITQPENYKHVFYVGTLLQSVSRPIGPVYPYGDNMELEAEYKGIKFGFQQIFTDNLAGNYVLNKGSLRGIYFVDEDGTQYESGIEAADEDYLGISASALLSTNLQKGWQFFTGLGLFHDAYSSDDGDYTFDGIILDLGLGYSWQTIQTQLHYQGRFSGDYADDVSVGNFSLQVGFNF